MSVELDKLIFYSSESSDGGGPDFTSPQSSGSSPKEFKTITRDDMVLGATIYVKQYLRNENTYPWLNVAVYISQSPSRAPNTHVSFCISGSKSKTSGPATLSGTATVTATGYIETSLDLRAEIRPGDKIFNSTDDTSAFSARVVSVSSNAIVVDPPYAGTIGTGKEISVVASPDLEFIYPASINSPSTPIIDLEAGEYCGIWKRYTVFEGCPPFSADTFSITFEEK